MKPLDSDRDLAVQLLSAHYANGSLSTHELEVRFERVYKAKDTDALQALLGGLPALPVSVQPTPGMYAVATGGPVPAEKRTLVIMSESKRRGEWTPAQRNVVKVIMGQATFDLREALLMPGAVIEFDVLSLMGEILFIVPPGVAVECEGMPIMGSFDDSTSLSAIAPDAPRIRVTGSAIMGSVKVRTRLPGESALAAWRRQLTSRSR